MLQEDLDDLKEQITMYESAVKHSVIGLDLSEEWENQLSDSCVDLGLKKSNRKNGLLHRYSVDVHTGGHLLEHLPQRLLKLTHLPSALLSSALTRLSDSKPSRDDTLRQLRAEMQRCLGSLKGKRQKISQLQEELQLCQGRVNELQGQLDEAKLGTQVRTKLDAGVDVVMLPNTGLVQMSQVNLVQILVVCIRLCLLEPGKCSLITVLPHHATSTYLKCNIYINNKKIRY